MPLFGSADKMEFRTACPIQEAEHFHRLFEFRKSLVHERLRAHAFILRPLKNFQAVFVRAGIKKNFIAGKFFVPGHRVRPRELKGVPHVQGRVHVRQSGGDIKIFLGHGFLS